MVYALAIFEKDFVKISLKTKFGNGSLRVDLFSFNGREVFFHL